MVGATLAVALVLTRDLLLNCLLFLFNALEKLVERIGKLLHTLILQLLRHLVVVDSHLLQCFEYSSGLRKVVLNRKNDSTMVAEFLNGLEWHRIHRIGANQFLSIQHITIGGIFLACSGPYWPLYMCTPMSQCLQTRI